MYTKCQMTDVLRQRPAYYVTKTKIEPKYNTEETVKWQLPGERSFSAQWLGRWETGRIFPSSSAGLQETACIVVPLANQSFFSFLIKHFIFPPRFKNIATRQ